MFLFSEEFLVICQKKQTVLTNKYPSYIKINTSTAPGALISLVSVIFVIVHAHDHIAISSVIFSFQYFNSYQTGHVQNRLEYLREFFLSLLYMYSSILERKMLWRK